MEAPLEIKRLALKYDVAAYRFNLAWLCKFGTVKSNHDIIQKDISRTHFLGSKKEFDQFQSIWKKTRTMSYSQGNMVCAFPKIIFHMPQQRVNPFKIQFFDVEWSFLNNQGIESGISIHVRKNHPKNWMIGIAINGSAMPKNRDVIFYLTPYREWEILEEEVDLKDMQKEMHNLKHFDQSISLEKMRSTILQDIDCDMISPIIALLIEDDCTINMPLIEIINKSMHSNGTYLIAVKTILDTYYEYPSTHIQSTLNTKTIIGCETFLQTSLNLPHNSGIRTTIRNLLNDLKNFPDNTLDTLESFFAITEAISSKNDVVSCILIAYMESSFLRSAFKLEEFSKDVLENSETQRVRCLEIVKENICTQRNLVHKLK